MSREPEPLELLPHADGSLYDRERYVLELARAAEKVGARLTIHPDHVHGLVHALEVLGRLRLERFDALADASREAIDIERRAGGPS